MHRPSLVGAVVPRMQPCDLRGKEFVLQMVGGWAMSDGEAVTAEGEEPLGLWLVSADFMSGPIS